MEHFRNTKSNPSFILQLNREEETEHIGCTHDQVLDYRFKRIASGVFKVRYKSFS